MNAAPTAINAEIEKKHELMATGTREEAIIRSYTISVQRKPPHPAVRAITEKAGEWLFKENM